MALVATLFEAFSYFLFAFVLPADLRSRALLAVGQVEESGSVPEIRPYLWSNYAPNPASTKVNEMGWHYGGRFHPGHLRILCLGGSTTWSTGVTAAEASFPAQLEAWLRGQGWAVDVVDGSAPYYSSAELVGVLAFRGVAIEPDLVLIHTGENDLEPLLSPLDYRPDYSHWRSASFADSPRMTRDDLTRVVWRVPSWTLRLFTVALLKPAGRDRATLGRQVTRIQEALLATNDVSSRRPLGLERNLRNLIALSRVHGAVPATLRFNVQLDRLDRLVPAARDDAEARHHVEARVRFAIEVSNEAITRVSDELGVAVVPFDRFRPSSPSSWLDHCHLNDEGSREKARFVGRSLVELGVLDAARHASENRRAAED